MFEMRDSKLRKLLGIFWDQIHEVVFELHLCKIRPNELVLELVRIFARTVELFKTQPKNEPIENFELKA